MVWHSSASPLLHATWGQSVSLYPPAQFDSVVLSYWGLSGHREQQRQATMPQLRDRGQGPGQRCLHDQTCKTSTLLILRYQDDRSSSISLRGPTSILAAPAGSRFH